MSGETGSQHRYPQGTVIAPWMVSRVWKWCESHAVAVAVTTSKPVWTPMGDSGPTTTVIKTAKWGHIFLGALCSSFQLSSQIEKSARRSGEAIQQWPSDLLRDSSWFLLHIHYNLHQKYLMKHTLIWFSVTSASCRCHHLWCPSRINFKKSTKETRGGKFKTFPLCHNNQVKVMSQSIAL